MISHTLFFSFLIFNKFLTKILILGVENELESVTDILSRFDKTLEEHNIDSSSCMQRVICTYVQDAQKNIMSGQPNTLDEFIQTVTR